VVAIGNGIGLPFLKGVGGAGDTPVFIDAWQAATGDVMGDAQKTVVSDTLELLRGFGTPNGSNLINKFSGTNSVILPYVPKDDSTAYLSGYALDLLTGNTVVTWYNFVPANCQPGGMAGSGYGVLNVQPADFGQDDIMAGYYFIAYNSASINDRILGTPRLFTNSKNSAGRQPTQFNSTTRTDFTGLSPVGVNAINRNSSSQVEKYVNGSLVQTLSAGSTTPESLDIFLYDQNNGSGLPSGKRNRDTVGGWFFGVSLNANEMEDLHFAIQYLNDNIITGGR